MKITESFILAFYICIAIFSIYFGYLSPTKDTIILPCGVAEISPDFSQQQRDQCRLIRSGSKVYEYRSK